MGGWEALGKEGFETTDEVRDALSEAGQVGVRKAAEDVVGEVLLWVLLRSDAQTGADELVAKVADATGHAVVSGGGTSQGEAELTGLERDVIMENNELAELDPVKPEEGRKGRPAVVHKGEWLDELHGETSERNLRDCSRKTAFFLPLRPSLVGQSVDDNPRGVVPGGGIFSAGIAEGGEDRE